MLIYYEKWKQFWTLKPWIHENKSFAKDVKVLFVRENQSTQNAILRKNSIVLLSIIFI